MANFQSASFLISYTVCRSVVVRVVTTVIRDTVSNDRRVSSFLIDLVDYGIIVCGEWKGIIYIRRLSPGESPYRAGDAPTTTAVIEPIEFALC